MYRGSGPDYVDPDRHRRCVHEPSFAGNPAAVCVLSEPRPDEWLRHVARELNLSETAFLSIGYWTPQDAPASENTLIFILAHDSRYAASRHWKEFRDDPEWQKLANASEADGQIIERVESTYLLPTDYSALR